MPIKFSCSACGKHLRAPDDAAGRKCRCPDCGAVATVPEDGQPSLHSPAVNSTDSGHRAQRPEYESSIGAAKPTVLGLPKPTARIVGGIVGVGVIAIAAIAYYGYSSSQRRMEGRNQLIQTVEEQIDAANDKAGAYDFAGARGALLAATTEVQESPYADVCLFDQLNAKIDTEKDELRRHENDYRDKVRRGWSIVDGRFIPRSEKERILAERERVATERRLREARLTQFCDLVEVCSWRSYSPRTPEEEAFFKEHWNQQQEAYVSTITRWPRSLYELALEARLEPTTVVIELMVQNPIQGFIDFFDLYRRLPQGLFDLNILELRPFGPQEVTIYTYTEAVVSHTGTVQLPVGHLETREYYHLNEVPQQEIIIRIRIHLESAGAQLYEAWERKKRDAFDAYVVAISEAYIDNRIQTDLLDYSYNISPMWMPSGEAQIAGEPRPVIAYDSTSLLSPDSGSTDRWAEYKATTDPQPQTNADRAEAVTDPWIIHNWTYRAVQLGQHDDLDPLLRRFYVLIVEKAKDASRTADSGDVTAAKEEIDSLIRMMLEVRNTIATLYPPMQLHLDLLDKSIANFKEARENMEDE